MSTSRTQPVVEFASEALADVVQVLRRVLGRTVSLLAFTLLEETAGFAVAAAASTDIGITNTNFNFADAGIDQLRVQCYGNTAGGANIAVLVYDITNSRELCRVGLGIPVGLYVGAWTQLPAAGDDALLVVRIIGDSVNAQTLKSVRVQGRTTRAV